MNKKILMSSISILSALALVGGGAFALFTSTASNNGNTFGAGTLTLSINTFTGATSTPVFTVPGAVPGTVYGPMVLDLRNDGSVPATSVKLSGIDVTGTTLADNLTLELANDINGNNAIDPGETVGTAHLTNAGWTNLDLGFGLAAGASRKVLARITFDSATPNTVQGATTTFNFNFLASQ